MEKQRKKRPWLALVYIAINLGVLTIIALTDKSWLKIGDAFKSINVWWVLLAVAMMGAYLLTDAWKVQYATRVISQKKCSFSLAFRTGVLGLYYNAITPTATAGQPFQIYYLYRHGIPVGQAGASFMFKYVAYQAGVTFFAILAFIFYGAEFFRHDRMMFVFSLIGFCLASGIPILILILGSHLGAMKKISNFVSFVSRKLRLSKNPEGFYERMQEEIVSTHTALQMLKHQPKAIFVQFGIGLLNTLALTSVTFFLFLAFGGKNQDYLRIMFVTNLLLLAASYFPAPGATGAMEAAFAAIFSKYFIGLPMSPIVLIWRTITYYSILALGALFTLRDGTRNMMQGAATKTRELLSDEINNTPQEE